MIKHYLKSKINVFFLILEILLIISSISLNYLSFKKMGLMRHLIFKNYMYDKINIYLILSILSIFLILIYLFFLIKCKTYLNFVFIFFIVLSFLSFNKIITKFKYDYYFQSFIFLTISFLEILKIIIKKFIIKYKA